MPEDTSAPSDVLAPVLPPADEGAKAVFRAPRWLLWLLRFGFMFFFFGVGYFCLYIPLSASRADAVGAVMIGIVMIAPVAFLCHRSARKLEDHVGLDGYTISYASAKRGVWTVRWEEVTEIRESSGALGPYVRLFTHDRGVKTMTIPWSTYPNRSDFAAAVHSCFRAANGLAPVTTTLPVNFRLGSVGASVVVLSLAMLVFVYPIVVGALPGILLGLFCIAFLLDAILKIPVSVTVDTQGLVVDRIGKRRRYGFELIAGVSLHWDGLSVTLAGRRGPCGWVPLVPLSCAKEGAMLMYYTLFSAWQAWKQERQPR